MRTFMSMSQFMSTYVLISTTHIGCLQPRLRRLEPVFAFQVWLWRWSTVAISCLIVALFLVGHFVKRNPILLVHFLSSIGAYFLRETRFLHVELVDVVDVAGSPGCSDCGEQPGVHPRVSVGFWHGSTGEVESEVACEV